MSYVTAMCYSILFGGAIGALLGLKQKKYEEKNGLILDQPTDEKEKNNKNDAE